MIFRIDRFTYLHHTLHQFGTTICFTGNCGKTNAIVAYKFWSPSCPIIFINNYFPLYFLLAFFTRWPWLYFAQKGALCNWVWTRHYGCFVVSALFVFAILLFLLDAWTSLLQVIRKMEYWLLIFFIFAFGCHQPLLRCNGFEFGKITRTGLIDWGFFFYSLIASGNLSELGIWACTRIFLFECIVREGEENIWWDEIRVQHMKYETNWKSTEWWWLRCAVVVWFVGWVIYKKVMWLVNEGRQPVFYWC